MECVVKSSHWLACWLAALVGGCVTIPPTSWRCEDKEHRNNDNDNTTGTYISAAICTPNKSNKMQLCGRAYGVCANGALLACNIRRC